MRRLRPVGTLTLSCPECGADLDVTLAGPDRSVGIMASTIEEIIDPAATTDHPGCQHIETLLNDETFYQAVLEIAEAGREDAEDDRYEAWRDRYEATRDEERTWRMNSSKRC